MSENFVPGIFEQLSEKKGEKKNNKSEQEANEFMDHLQKAIEEIYGQNALKEGDKWAMRAFEAARCGRSEKIKHPERNL